MTPASLPFAMALPTLLVLVAAGLMAGALLAIGVLSLFRTGSPAGTLRCLALALAAVITVALVHGVGIGV